MVWLLVIVLVAAGVLGFLVGAWRLRALPALVGAACWLVAFVIVLIYVTRPAETEPLDPNPSASFRIVAVGDSYISGEGAQRYFPGTDEPRSNECHRAASAHPYLVAKKLHASLTFIACSGARTRDVTGPAPGQFPRSDEDVFGALPQVAALRGIDGPDVILVSIGGNDAGFAEIGLSCATPGEPDCRRSASYWVHRLDSRVYPALLSTYRTLRAAAPGVPVYALTYPNPLGPKNCRDILLDPPEMEFIRDVFIGRLNRIVTYAAQRELVGVLDLTHALDGHRICERPLPKAAVNFIELGRTDGSTLKLSIKGLAGLAHGTFHPNRLGHELVAKALLHELEAVRSGEPTPLPPPPKAAAPPPFVPDEIGPQDFPKGTRCTGKQIEVVSPLTAEAEVRTVALSGLRPRSTVCYRQYRATWHSKRADSAGAVDVPVEVRRAGVGGINEVLAEQNGGVWKKVVVSRLGADDEDDPPEEPSNLGLYLVIGALGISILVALVLRWISLGRRKRRAEPSDSG